MSVFPYKQDHEVTGSDAVPRGGIFGPMGVVYVVNNPVTGLVKIGISKEPRVRIQGLEWGCGCLFSSIFISRAIKSPARLEGELHFIFRDKHVLGEWFREEWEVVVEQARKRLSGDGFSREYDWKPQLIAS